MTTRRVMTLIRSRRRSPRDSPQPSRRLADQCDGLPAVPGITTCLTLVVTPKGASDDCVVSGVDQTGRQNGKLERGAKIPVEVDCSAVETAEAPVETTEATVENTEANSDE
jgi:hypothetical protein